VPEKGEEEPAQNPANSVRKGEGPKDNEKWENEQEKKGKKAKFGCSVT